MSKISKLSFLFSGISLVCLLLGRMALEGWHHVLWVPLGLFLVLLIFPFVKDGRVFADFFRMKTTKQGFSMGTMIVLVVAALAIVNVIAVRKYATWDFSAAKTNTLSDQSIKLLKNLDSDLKVVFFYKNGQEGTDENRRAFRELIKKYQDQTDKIRLDFVEVNERPDLAADYGVTKGSGVVFLEYKGRRNRIERIDEQEITSALVKATREKDKTIYVVTGHGELDLEETREAAGANALKQLLAGNRYTVKTLPLAVQTKIPDDADAIAVLGPLQNYLDHEITALEQYLQRGGSLWLALESKRTAGLEKLLAKIGLQSENNYVLNVVETVMGKGISQGPTMGAVFSPNSDITKVFTGNEFALFQAPTGLKIVKAMPGITLDEIVKSPPSSMAFQTLDITKEGEGPVGQYTFGITATGKWPGAGEKAKDFLLAVYGDAGFLTNALLYQNLNRDLALNTTAALVKEENMISIAPRDAGITQMHLTEWNLRMFVWTFVVPLPLLMLAIAITLWTRRRFA